MYKQISALFVFVLLYVISTAAVAGNIQLPQTGQTKCYDTNNAEVSCVGTGQDGNIRAGVAWPNPRFIIGTGAESECVTDNLTGLMWARNGNLSNGKMTWYQAIDYASNLCGYSDWRLPNVNELESLTNANEPNAISWLDSQGFYNMQSGYYWASTTSAYYTDRAWIVNILYGQVRFYTKGNYNYIWPVRAGQSDSPDPVYPANISKTGQTTSYTAGDDGDIEQGVVWPNTRFSFQDNGTVADNLTGLIWTKDANAPGPSACSPETSKAWQSALDYVACLNTNNYLGYNDWRLPNRKELRSLLDYSNHDPALSSGHPFTSVQTSQYYWSSSTGTYNNSGGYAWVVDMFYGYMEGMYKAIGYYVWPVRGGHVGDSDGDSDGDGLPDEWEIQYFSDLAQGLNDDYDHDDLTNLQECQIGTDPTKWDTDGDGVNDGTEVAQGKNPLDPNDQSDNTQLVIENIEIVNPSTNEIGAFIKVRNNSSLDAINIEMVIRNSLFSEGTVISIQKIRRNTSRDSEVVKWVLKERVSDNFTISAEIASSNSKVEKRLSVYYADPFYLDREAYSFRNFRISDFVNSEELGKEQRNLQEELLESNGIWTRYVRFASLFIDPFAWQGHCFGMASTSILYRDNEIDKPLAKTTYEMSLSDNGVWENISKYHVMSIGYLHYLLKDIDLNVEYQTAQDYIATQNKPFMLILPANLNLGWPIIESPGHVVVGYKIIDFGEEKRIYIYDNEIPYVESDPNKLSLKQYITYKPSENKADWDGVTIRPYSKYPLTWGSLPDEIKQSIQDTASQLFDLFQGKIVALFHCPVEVVMHDQFNRQIGYINGNFINEIPEAFVGNHMDGFYFILPSELIYDVEILGKASGNLNAYYFLIQDKNIFTDVTFKNISITDSFKGKLEALSLNSLILTMQADVDGDGVYESKILPTVNPDADNDLVSDYIDNCINVPNSNQTDSDNDGTGDACDACPNDPNKTSIGICGCGIADNDYDNDGTPDCKDQCPNDPAKIVPGVCGCGEADIDTDNDGVADCIDLCPNDPLKAVPGTCGCGVSETDSDGDGTPDCKDQCQNDPAKVVPGACGCSIPDTDSDNDGMPDCMDNCVDTFNPDQSDSNSNGIGDACDFKKVCSYLGNDPHPLLPDVDIFKFSGTKGETVTIRIDANPPEADAGRQVSLILTDKIKRTVLLKLDRSEIPNEITAKLPATGEYVITVAEQLLIAKGKRYRGNYCLTLKARPETYNTLAAYLWVE
jgi:hypothetical protein